MRAACGWAETRRLKVARFGDNMREVAVTEGDKVAAQRQFGYSVNGYGVGDLVAVINEVTETEIDALARAVPRGRTRSGHAEAQQANLREQARIEAGMRAFLREGGFSAFTTTFEDLHGLAQLPGLAVQRLMADGLRLRRRGRLEDRRPRPRAEGHGERTAAAAPPSWRTTPTTSTRRARRSSAPTCSRSAPRSPRRKPSLEVHPLGIGGKADPARLVFNVAPGPALNASLVDLGNRFRLIVNAVDVVPPDAAAPEAADRTRGLGPPAEPQGRGGRLDPRGRRPPHRLQPGSHPGAPRGLRRDGGHRAGH